MSRWGRMLGAGGGVAMIVGGLLELEGYRWGWMLVVTAAVACGFVVSDALGTGKR
jgi:hypothetical protein